MQKKRTHKETVSRGGVTAAAALISQTNKLYTKFKLPKYQIA